MANRYRILVLFLMFGLVACGKKDKRADDQLATEKKTAAFLASIPADTPYVMASLEPIPLGPVFQWMELFSGALGGMADEIDAVLADEYLDAGTKAIFAFMDEMQGNFSREGFEDLGFSASPRMALYGLGPLPVIKMDLGDPDKFAALLTRVEERSGLRRVTETVGEHQFWSYSTGPDEMLVMTVQNRQVIFGITPTAAAPTFVEYLVGEKTPDASLEKDGRLGTIATTWGFQRFAVGYIDLARITQMYVDPQPGLNDELLRALTTEPPAVSGACKSELTALAGAAPRIVFGYEEWTPTAATFAAAWELKNDLGTQLAASQTAAPLSSADLSRNAALAVAFGFDVGKVIDVVRTRAAAIRDNPYQCEWFLPLNQAAGEVAMATTAFVPPIVSQIQGAALVVTDIREAAPTTSAVNPADVSTFNTAPSVIAEGAVAVVAQDPIALFDFLKSLVPEFAGLVAKADGTPTPLPPAQGMEMFELPQVVVTPKLLVVTSGDTMSEDIARRAEPAAESPFFMFAYDYAKIWKVVGGAATLPAFGKLAGTMRVEVNPTAQGIHMRARMPIAAAPTPAPAP